MDYDDVNIFFTHLNPTIAAEFCCDAHVRKMVLESTQLLANAYYLPNATHAPPPKSDGTPYKPAHQKHPCAVWAVDDFKQWDWLRVHAYGLAKEYEFRFGSLHACWHALNYMTEHLPTPWMSNKVFLAPPLAMPEEFRSRVTSPLGCYRKYIREAKRHLHKWTKRAPPFWLFDDYKQLRHEADRLVDLCEVVCFNADDYRDGLGCAPSLCSDDEWGSIVEAANHIANGRDHEDESGVAEQLFDKCSLEFLGADLMRPEFPDFSDAEWQVIKATATQIVNGLDPLSYPKDWDLTHYRG